MNKVKWSYLTFFIFILIMIIGTSSLNAKKATNLKIDIKKAITEKPGLYLTWSYTKPYGQTTQVSYYIERNVNNSGWKKIIRSGGERLKKYYIDQAVAPNVNYCYRVRISGQTSWSDPVCFHTPSIPTAPKNLKGQIKYPQPGKNEFIIDWQDRANNESGFEVKYIGYYGKTEYLSPNSYYFNLIKKHENCPPITFKVRAYNLYYSPFAEVTLDADPNPVPGPKDLKVNQLRNNQVTLIWSNPVPYSSLRIERKDLGTTGLRKKGFQIIPKFKNIRFISPANSITHYIDNTVKPSSKYIYRIEWSYNNSRGYSTILEVKTPGILRRKIR